MEFNSAFKGLNNCALDGYGKKIIKDARYMYLNN
jgi:hypothetical protein